MAPDSSPPPTLWQRLTSPPGDSVQPWLHWHPSQLDACVRERAKHLPAPLTAEEVEAMVRAHRRWGADEASLRAVERLAEPNARVVVQGQQPGLLGGPLYTLYKALGGVKLAAKLAGRHPELTFVPVFWVASEDHDYEEVSTAVWPRPGGELCEFRFDHPDWLPGKMVGRLAAAPLVEPLVAAILESTTETEFRAGEIERLREDAVEADWETLFCRTLLRLTRGTGLVVVSPLMPWVRRRGAAILAQEFAFPGRSSSIVLERSAELAAAGLEAPLHRAPDAVNAFAVDAQDRRGVLRCRAGRIVGPDAGEAGAIADVDDLTAALDGDPERFSTNVVTRPLVQDAILPTVAQLVGPGEAAYFAQVEAVYPTFGVFAPVRYPRPRVLLVSRAVERSLAKHDLTAGGVAGTELKALLEGIHRRRGADDVMVRLGGVRERQCEELTALKTELKRGSASEAAMERLIQSVEKGFDTVAQRYGDDQKREAPEVEAAMRKLRANLAPLDKPQERVFNALVPFSVQYGPDWIEGLRAAMRVDAEAGLLTHALRG